MLTYSFNHIHLLTRDPKATANTTTDVGAKIIENHSVRREAED